MNDLALKELMRSRDEKHILTGRITGIENEYYSAKNQNISCAIIWYEGIKVLIPSSHLGTYKSNKSIIRGMLGAEVDFLVIEIDFTANIAIASRKDAMELRASIELPKLKQNDVVGVRILAVGVTNIIVELYGKEVIIRAGNLQHTYIINCKDYYKAGDYLKVRIKNIDLSNDLIELDAKCFLENPYQNIRKFIEPSGEYTGTVVGFVKKNGNAIVQLDASRVTCIVRIPARFSHIPHFMEKVSVQILEINENKKFISAFLKRIL